MASPALVIHGRYQLSGKPVGQGGMGVVYKAYDLATKRFVALKSMRGALSPSALELFNKEWSVLAHLSHPNIVDVLDTGDFEQDNERQAVLRHAVPARRDAGTADAKLQHATDSGTYCRDRRRRHAGDCRRRTNRV